MNQKKIEKYRRELQDRVEIHTGGADQKLFIEYHKLINARNKEDLLERARKVRMAEVFIREAPLEITLRRGSHFITFREASFVRYLLELSDELKKIHDLEKFRGFFLVFPDPKYPDYPEKYEQIPFAYLITPGQKVPLFGKNEIKMTRIYRATVNKKPDYIMTNDIMKELEAHFDRYLENAYLSRFGSIFYKPTYPYIHW